MWRSKTSELKTHAGLDFTWVEGARGLTEIRRGHHARGYAIVCAIERIGHVGKHIHVRPRVAVLRRAEEKCLRDIEVEIERVRAAAAASRDTWQPVIDGAVLVIVLTCNDGVPLAAIHRHRFS